MDLTLPDDRMVKARLLQVQEFHVGTRKRGSGGPYTGGNSNVTLKVAVSWIEAFGVLHMAWAVDEGARELNMEELRQSLPEKRIAFSDSVSEAGRTGVDWVREVVTAFDKHIRSLGPALEFAAAWEESPWRLPTSSASS